MRSAFISVLEDLAEKNKDIFLLSPDMGFSVFENFRKKFPGRFINTGIAEANTIGIAAGLALSGKKVFVYSIIPFVTMRCFEQIRMDLCYQNLDVKLIGVGGGLCYGPAGPSHHAIEDIAVMRALPNMKVICPGDPLETFLAVKESLIEKGPVYIRLAKTRDPLAHKKKSLKFRIGKGIVLNKGKDVTIVAAGGMLYNAKIAKDILSEKGIDAGLISMHTVKPIDKKLILDLLKNTKAVFTVEEHSLIGGLGSAVSEIIAESGCKKVYFKRISLPDIYVGTVGSQKYLHKKYKLLPEQIAETIISSIERKAHEK